MLNARVGDSWTRAHVVIVCFLDLLPDFLDLIPFSKTVLVANVQYGSFVWPIHSGSNGIIMIQQKSPKQTHL